jgi:hypothetical protein
MWLPSNPHVNCRLANLDKVIETTIGWFSHRAGNEINSFVGLLFPFAAFAAKGKNYSIELFSNLC